MDSFGEFIFAVFVIGLAAMVVVGVTGMYNDYQSPNDYAYIDMDGNTGFANYCSNDYGALVCTKGEEKIAVKKYTKVEE